MNVFDVASPQVAVHLIEHGFVSKRRSIPQTVRPWKVRVRSVSLPDPPSNRWKGIAAAAIVMNTE